MEFDFLAWCDLQLWEIGIELENNRWDALEHFGCATERQLMQIAVLMERVRFEEEQSKYFAAQFSPTLSKVQADEILSELTAIEAMQERDPKRQLEYMLRQKTMI